MSEMKYIEIPYVDKPVSRIIFGTATPPYIMGGDNDTLLDAAVAAGINTLDMARNYMGSEIAIGRWMEKRGNRKNLVLLSKCGHTSVYGKDRITEYDIRKDFRKSSGYLGTEYIDIYLVHRDNFSIPAGDVIEIFNAMHAEGKIGAFGVSNWTHQRIEEGNEYAYKHNLIPFSVSSPGFGLAEQSGEPWGGGEGCVSIAGPGQKDARAWYRRNDMPVIAYSSLGRGLFTGKVKSSEPEKAGQILDGAAMKGYFCDNNLERLRRCELLAEKKSCSVSQIAMAWIFNQELKSCAVVSMSGPHRIISNVEAMCMELTSQECAYLDLQSETWV